MKRATEVNQFCKSGKFGSKSNMGRCENGYMLSGTQHMEFRKFNLHLGKLRSNVCIAMLKDGRKAETSMFSVSFRFLH